MDDTMGSSYNTLGRFWIGSLLLSVSVLTYAAREDHYASDHIADSQSLSDQYTDASLRSLKKLTADQLKVNAVSNQPDLVKDPLQPLNRKIFIFNESLDKHIARPLAVQYARVVPVPVRESYTNFRSNLREPWSGVNQILQLKPRMAAKSFARVALNTLTSLGFADLASKKKIVSDKDDLGLTLGVWGVPSGAYVMLPFIGPRTLRDTATYLVDSYANPQRYILDSSTNYLAYRAADAINTRADLLSVDDIFQGDRNALIRDAYLQQRASAIAMRRGEDISQTLFADDPLTDDPTIDDSSAPSPEVKRSKARP